MACRERAERDAALRVDAAIEPPTVRAGVGIPRLRPAIESDAAPAPAACHSESSRPLSDVAGAATPAVASKPSTGFHAPGNGILAATDPLDGARPGDRLARELARDAAERDAAPASAAAACRSESSGPSAAVSPGADPLDGLTVGQPLTPAILHAIEALRARPEPPWVARVGRLAKRDAEIRDLAALLPAGGVTLTADAVAAELARAASLPAAADRPDDPVRACARRVLALQPGGLEWRQVTRILAGHRS